MSPRGGQVVPTSPRLTRACRESTSPSQTPLLPEWAFAFDLDGLAPPRATRLPERLREQRIPVKPLGDRRLGPGFRRVTTARPENNGRFVQALRALL